MHCHECQNTMRQFIDGKVDSQTRKEAGQDEAAEEGVHSGMNKLSRGTNLKIIRWAATRNSSPKLWHISTAILFGLILLSYLLK